MWTIGLALAVAGVGLLLGRPWSPARAAFRRLTAGSAGAVSLDPGVFTEADLEPLPEPVQRYFRHCGYLGTPRMSWLTAQLWDVEFVASRNRVLGIDYRQFNLTARPERYALISSAIMGIPFEGLDSYNGDRGSMRGVLAKAIPLFHQRGTGLDRSCLVTWLAECLLAPSAALQQFVEWKPIDHLHAKATITWGDISAGGVFTFTTDGELRSFRTGDRLAVGLDGKEAVADWSGLFGDYHVVNGILQPAVLQSVWHFEDGDVTYFNKNASVVRICYGRPGSERRPVHLDAQPSSGVER